MFNVKDMMCILFCVPQINNIGLIINSKQARILGIYKNEQYILTLSECGKLQGGR